MRNNIKSVKFTNAELIQFITYMKQQASGKQNTKFVRQVAAGLGYPNNGHSAAEYRKIRAMAHAAIVHMHVPICADNSGYFVAETKDEAKDSLFRLKSVAESLMDRYYALQTSL